MQFWAQGPGQNGKDAGGPGSGGGLLHAADGDRVLGSGDTQRLVSGANQISGNITVQVPLIKAGRIRAIALGSRENEVVRKVVLPAAFGGILTGILLAVARIAGETAPLIFTSLGNSNWSTDLTKPMASLPIAIYRYAGSPYEDWKALAWTGALLITVGVLALNIASRLSLAAIKRGRG